MVTDDNEPCLEAIYYFYGAQQLSFFKKIMNCTNNEGHIRLAVLQRSFLVPKYIVSC